MTGLIQGPRGTLWDGSGPDLSYNNSRDAAARHQNGCRCRICGRSPGSEVTAVFVQGSLLFMEPSGESSTQLPETGPARA